MIEIAGAAFLLSIVLLMAGILTKLAYRDAGEIIMAVGYFFGGIGLLAALITVMPTLSRLLG